MFVASKNEISVQSEGAQSMTSFARLNQACPTNRNSTKLEIFVCVVVTYPEVTTFPASSFSMILTPSGKDAMDSSKQQPFYRYVFLMVEEARNPP